MMTTHHDMENGTPSPRKGDKVEVVKILVLALVSFVLGFGLVIFFLSPKDDANGADVAETLFSEQPEAGTVTPTDTSPKEAPVADEGYAQKETNPLMAQLENSGEQGAGSAGDAPEEVPPGRTPDGVTLDGDAFYLKCWNSAGEESPGSACDPLRVLEKRFSTRLYVVNKCREQHAAGKEGKLSLGIEVDFGENSLSFWNGASSTLPKAQAVATCLRGELRGLPLHSVTHKFDRYRLFFTVLFGKGAGTADDVKSLEPPKKLPKGKMVNVIKDRVRVRTAPVDGDIIGKISTGNEVKLLGQKGDWCQVLTPNKNEGWMICDALSK